MGVQGLWAELKPYGHRTDTTADISERVKSLTELQGKILAVDLSFWICATVGTYNHPVHGQLSAVVAKPHLRNVFYRTVKLISRIGALPIFVVDGDAPSLKMRERLKRFHAMNGTRMPEDSGREHAGSVRRNYEFESNVQEVVDLLRLMGLPVIFARAEAEALCAQLNAAGHADACVTPDSDALLYGAKTVMKELAVDLRKPVVDRFEASEIAQKMGLGRPHLVALALILGNDFDAKGVEGCGPKRAIKLVQGFPEDEILDRLRAWGRGEKPTAAEMFGADDVAVSKSQNATSSTVKKPSHCGTCGHPGKVIEHRKGGCRECGTEGGECGRKEKGFQCQCDWCVQDCAGRARRQEASWWEKVLEMIARQPNFPNEDIIRIFMGDEPESLSHMKGGQIPLDQLLVWGPPDLQGLGTVLTAKCEESEAHWQMKALPLATAHYLSQVMSARLPQGLPADLGCIHRVAKLAALPGFREGFDSPDDLLLDGSFKPSKVERIKVDATEALYRLEWQRVAGKSEPVSSQQGPGSSRGLVSEGVSGDEAVEAGEQEGQQGLDDEEPKKVVLEWRKAGGFTTDERKILVEKAFPSVAGAFEEQRNAVLQAKAQKEAEKEARKKERAAKAALKQTDLKSFFATKKGGAKARAKVGKSTAGDSAPITHFFTSEKQTKEDGVFKEASALGARLEGDRGKRESDEREDGAARDGSVTAASGSSVLGDHWTAFEARIGKGQDQAPQEAERDTSGAESKKKGVSGLGNGNFFGGKPRTAEGDGFAAEGGVAEAREVDTKDLRRGDELGGRFSPLEPLPESPFTLHPGFRKLADLQRRLSALSSPPALLTSAGGPDSSAGGAAAQTGGSVMQAGESEPEASIGGSGARGPGLLTSADGSGGRSRRKLFGAGLPKDWLSSRKKAAEVGTRGSLKEVGAFDGGMNTGGDMRDRKLEGRGKGVITAAAPTGLLGTREMPVEFVDSPPRPPRKAVGARGKDSTIGESALLNTDRSRQLDTARDGAFATEPGRHESAAAGESVVQTAHYGERVMTAGEGTFGTTHQGGASDSRPTTPVRRSPEKCPREIAPGESPPVTPSKRPAEESLVEHTPPKRLTNQFAGARYEKEEGCAAVERSPARQLVYEDGVLGQHGKEPDIVNGRFGEMGEGRGGAGKERGIVEMRSGQLGVRDRRRNARNIVEDPHQAKVTDFIRREGETPGPEAATHVRKEAFRCEGERGEGVSGLRKDGRMAPGLDSKSCKRVEMIDLVSDDEADHVTGRNDLDFAERNINKVVDDTQAAARVLGTSASATFVKGKVVGHMGPRPVLEIRKRRPR